MERETQLRNVAFGGNWSEALLEQDVAKSALSILRVAAENCMEEDPRGPELYQALGYVAARVEKGPVLASAFLKALAEPEQAIRRKGMMRCLRQIEIWFGF
jgi:hypothetical protein